MADERRVAPTNVTECFVFRRRSVGRRIERAR
jgi:hypothetical protein